MPKGMQPIYTQVVGAGGTSAVIFNNIPQTYTDLMLLVSARDNGSPGVVAQTGSLYFNLDGASSLYSNLVFRSIAGVSTFNSGTMSAAYAYIANNSYSSGNFSTQAYYITDYATNKFKQMIGDNFTENAQASWDASNIHVASLARINAPIRNITITPPSSFVQHSSFTLYGIGK